MKKSAKDKSQTCEKNERETEQSFIVKKVVDDGIFLYYQQKHRKFMYRDILWIEASGSYCNICLADHRQILFVYTLCQLYEKLPKEQFVRIHRSYIINVYAVTSFYHKMIYIGDRMFPISTPYLEDVISYFNCVDNKKALIKQEATPAKRKRNTKK